MTIDVCAQASKAPRTRRSRHCLPRTEASPVICPPTPRMTCDETASSGAGEVVLPCGLGEPGQLPWEGRQTQSPGRCTPSLEQMQGRSWSHLHEEGPGLAGGALPKPRGGEEVGQHVESKPASVLSTDTPRCPRRYRRPSECSVTGAASSAGPTKDGVKGERETDNIERNVMK